MEKYKELPNLKFKCMRCDKIYSRSDGAERHFNEEHLGKRKKCPVCEKQLRSQSYAKHLRLHNKSTHVENIEIKCKLSIDIEQKKMFSSVVVVNGAKFALMPVQTDAEKIEVAQIVE